MVDKKNKFKNLKNEFIFNHYLYKSIVFLIICMYFIVINTLYAKPDYGIAFMLVVLMLIGASWVLLPTSIDKVLTIVLLFIYTFYLLAQKIYYFAFNNYFNLKYAISLRSEVMTETDSVFELIKTEDYLMLGCFVLFMLAIILIKSDRKAKLKTKILFNLATTIIVLAIAYISYNIFDSHLAESDVDSFSYNESDRYIFEVIPSTDAYVVKFGINAYLISDIYKTFIAPVMNDYNDKSEDIDEYMAEKVVDTDTNEYTGLFEGKNLIMIQAESLMTIGIDPILTPTLYQLSTTGINFVNYSSPLLAGSTSDTEIMIQDSIYPATDGNIVMHSYANNTFPVTLAKLFKADDYTTSVFHNNYGIYYNRTTFYANDDYDTFYDTTEMGIENLSSDSVMMDYASWIIAEESQFYTYFITYSGHQPYNLLSVDDTSLSSDALAEYLDYIDIINTTYPGLDEFMQVYLAKCMSLDRGIASLILALETYDKLDDTVIVLFGDHYIKGYDEEDHLEDLKILNQDEATVPLIIWNVNGTYQEIDKYCNSLDVLPTLMNMFDIDYDKKAVFGYDIFDDDYIGYYFTVNGTIESEDFVFDYKTGLKLENDMTNDEASYWLDKFTRMKTICQKIIEIDYFEED